MDWNEEASAEAMKELEELTIYQADVSNYSDLAAAFARTWQQHKRLDFGKFVFIYVVQGGP